MKKKLEFNKETVTVLDSLRGGILTDLVNGCAQTQEASCTCLSKVGGVESCPIENSCPEWCLDPYVTFTCLTQKGKTCDGQFTC